MPIHVVIQKFQDFKLCKTNTTAVEMHVHIFPYSGVIFQYIGLQTVLWMFFHTATLFWSLIFPLHFRSFQSTHRTRYILVAMTTAGLLVPLVPALVPLAGQGYGFAARIPPQTCLTVSLKDGTYSLYIPVSVLGAFTLFLLVGIFWSVIKVCLILKHVNTISQVIHGFASINCNEH